MQHRLCWLFFACITAFPFSLASTIARAEDEPLPLRTEFLMQMSAELEDSQLLGDTPIGGRRIVYVKAGEFSGPVLKGQVLPGGGDWVLDGEAVDPSEYYFRTTPFFETAADKYAWPNKLVTVGVGRRTRTGVVYRVYAIK